MKIIATTFTEASATVAEVGEHFARVINGRVDVEFQGKTVNVWAKRYEDGEVAAFGFTGRYNTGSTAWRVSFSERKDGRQSIWFGRDDRSGKFNKSGISYAPEIFFSL